MKIYNEIYKKQRRNKRIQILKTSFLWLFKIIVVLFLSFCTVYFFGMQIKMSGNSMSPTIQAGDLVLINKFSAILSPKNGDLVAFHPNGNPLANIEIRRIVAKGGDKVKISNGYLFINEKKIQDDFPQMTDPGIAKDEITLSSDEYFVLSDNRNIMQDSRSPDIGMVKRSYCIGNAWFLSKPSKRIGFLH